MDLLQDPYLTVPSNLRHPTQAGDTRQRIPCIRVARPDGVVRHLGAIARNRRKNSGAILGQVLATLKVQFDVTLKSDGALSRFERGETTPRHLDAVIAAYAVETNDNPADYWAEALEAYNAAIRSGGAATSAAGAALEIEAQEAAQQQGADTAKRAPGSRGGRKRRASG